MLVLGDDVSVNRVSVRGVDGDVGDGYAIEPFASSICEEVGVKGSTGSCGEVISTCGDATVSGSTMGECGGIGVAGSS